jgi:hypothetical protein
VKVALRALIALAIAGVAVGLSPAAPPANAAVCALADHIGIVVDFGDHTSVVCAPQGSARNGAHLLGQTHRVRVNSSGLVCAIDGVPSEGCGEIDSNGHYAYWSYWHGTASSWAYSNVGPAGSKLSADVVEGWRWNPAGNANSDPPPRGPSDVSAICVPATTTAPPTTGAPAATAPPKGATTTTARASKPSFTTVPGETTSTVAADSSSSSSAASSSSDASSASDGTTSSELQRAAAITTSDDGGGRGSPLGLIAGVGLVGALGIGGTIVVRRRGAISE